RLQLLEAHALAGPPVTGRHGENDLVAVEGLERHAALPARGADDAQLELAPPDLLDHGMRVRHRQRDVDLPMELLKLAEPDRQTAAARPGRGTDPEPAAQLALRLLAELFEQLLLHREQPLRPAVEP